MREYLKYLTVISVVTISLIGSIQILGCNKTDHPFGINAPLGLDRPTVTPTPQSGTIEIYVQDSAIVSSGAVQGVSISLIEPGGVTFGFATTQPVVGYAAFNPENLLSGIWLAEVPAQSVSYQVVSSGVTTPVRRTYGQSTIPITISGAGQYAVTFSATGNIVSVSPVSQTMNLSIPNFLPLTVTYSQSGNLDVPVTVTMSGLPNLLSFSYLNPNSWQFGGGNSYFAAVTISKTSCYAQPISLTLAANDMSGNPITATGAVITKGWSVPVTALMDKHSLGGGPSQEVCYMRVDSANDCGISLYTISYQIGSSDPPGGATYGPYAVAAGQSIGVTYTGLTNPYVKATFTYPGGGQISSDIRMGNLSFDSFEDVGHSSY
ncbi:MAG TPA: hypothetical protein VHE12_00050 [bacterium]|nr:hypothetical protein [bacterium]